MNGNGKAGGGAPSQPHQQGGQSANQQPAQGQNPGQNQNQGQSQGQGQNQNQQPLAHFFRPQQARPPPDFHVAFQGAPPPLRSAPPHAHAHAHPQHDHHALKHYSQQQQQLFSFVGTQHAAHQHQHQHQHQHHAAHQHHQQHQQHAAHHQQQQHAHGAPPRQHRAPPVYSATSPPAPPVYMPLHHLQQNPLYGFTALAAQQFPQQQQQPRQSYFGGVQAGVSPAIIGQQSYQYYLNQNQQQPQYYLPAAANGAAQAQSLSVAGSMAVAGSLAVVPPAIVPAGPIAPPLAPATPVQHPPPVAQPERTRRPHAIDVRDPTTGRDILEDIYKSETTAQEPANAAIRDEFYRRVHDSVNESPERPQPRTPVVSAISDSPEIVPKIGGPPKPHRPPEPTPGPTTPPTSTPATSTPSLSPCDSPIPAPAPRSIETPSPIATSTTPRTVSPITTTSPECESNRDIPETVEAEAVRFPPSVDAIVDNGLDEKASDPPSIEDELPIICRSPPAPEIAESELDLVVDTAERNVRARSPEFISVIVREEKLDIEKTIPAEVDVAPALLRPSELVILDNEVDDAIVANELPKETSEAVTVPSNDLRCDEPEEPPTAVVVIDDRDKFVNSSIPQKLSDSPEKEIDVNDNVSKVEKFEVISEKIIDELPAKIEISNCELIMNDNISNNNIPNNVDKIDDESIEGLDDKSDGIDDEVKDETNEINDNDKKSAPRYPYKDGQWAPFNTSGKKCYDTEFLLALRQDPMSLKKPTHIDKLNLIVSDGLPKQKFASVAPGSMRSDNSFSNIRQDLLFPEFARNTSRSVLPSRKSQQGKSGSKGSNSLASVPSKPQVINISLSLREDVKLNEAQNAWKPKRMKTAAEEMNDAKDTQELYKKFRSILNKLTPEKFDKLIKQILELAIDTEERLKGVIDLVFEKAISEPSFSLTYASLCHNLKQLKVPNANETENVNFRYLIITKCQTEFEKASADETANLLKEKEIEECDDPDKKKEMKKVFEEEERRMRRRSVGNVRFIGELYKQGMIMPKIMVVCIEILIKKLEEETLECLCKLLTTIGKKLESEPGFNLQPYFNNMLQIINSKDKGISSRIRFMLQDVVDLRYHAWVPRTQSANPKTMDQIQLEVEMEQMNKTSYSGYPSSQKDDRPSNMNKRGGSKSATDEGWSPVPPRNARVKQQYTVDSVKLKALKTSSRLSEISLQPSTSALWSKGSNINTIKKLEMVPTHKSSTAVPNSNRKNSTETSNMFIALDNISPDSASIGSEMSAKGNPYRSKGASIERSTFNLIPTSEVAKKVNRIMSDLQNGDFDNLVDIVKDQFNKDDLPLSIQEFILWGLSYNKCRHMQAIGAVSGKLVNEKTIGEEDFVNIIQQCVIKMSDVFQKDSDIWECVSKFIWSHRTIHNFTLWQIHTSFSKLISSGMGYNLLLALFSEKVRESKETYVKELWEQARMKEPIMELFDWMPRMNVAEFMGKVPLSFLVYKEDKSISPEAACSYMLQLMRENENRDTVTEWIRKYIGESVKEAWFIRALTEAVYTYTVKPQETMQPRLDEVAFDRLKVYYPLLITYVGNHEELELQCLFAIQKLIFKLEHPPTFASQIFEHLWESGEVVSTDGFLAWEANNDLQEQEGKAVMVVSLTSFFTTMKTDAEESDGATPSVVDDEY